MEKLPPLAKVFEAWSALADGRVALDAEKRRASVASSNGEKAYTVTWSEHGDHGVARVALPVGGVVFR